MGGESRDQTTRLNQPQASLAGLAYRLINAKGNLGEYQMTDVDLKAYRCVEGVDATTGRDNHAKFIQKTDHDDFPFEFSILGNVVAFDRFGLTNGYTDRLVADWPHMSSKIARCVP